MLSFDTTVYLHNNCSTKVSSPLKLLTYKVTGISMKIIVDLAPGSCHTEVKVRAATETTDK